MGKGIGTFENATVPTQTVACAIAPYFTPGGIFQE